MMSRVTALVAASFVMPALLLAAACNGDSDADDASATPYIPPTPYTTEEALARLDDIEALVREPNRAIVALAGVEEDDLLQRAGRILNGETDTSGLDDVRISFEIEDRISAGEYLYNTVVDYAVPPFNEADATNLDTSTLDEFDLNRTFDADHSDGMTVSSVYRDAILQMMDLWYRH